MTGTADTEATEFHAIYNLEVMVIPTNRWLIRTEHPDVVYRTESEKFQAVVEEIRELHKQGRPALVGTISLKIGTPEQHAQTPGNSPQRPERQAA